MNAEDVKPFTRQNQLATKIESIRELLYVGIDCNKNHDVTGTHVILATVTEYLLTDLEECVAFAFKKQVYRVIVAFQV